MIWTDEGTRESRAISVAHHLHFEVETSPDGRFLLKDRVLRTGYWLTLEELEANLEQFV